MTADVSVPPRSHAPGPAHLDRRERKKTRRSYWRLLKHGDFRRYFIGSLLSNLGTWLQNTTQVLLAYQFGHSAFTVGLVVSAQFAGVLVLSPWAAVVADRIGGRRTLIGTQGISAVIVLWMAWSYHHHTLDEHTLVIGALGLGLAFSLALPVQTALVPGLVGSGDTEAAMAMNSVSYNAGRALAPALCVLVLVVVRPEWIFVINAASFAIFAMVLARLKRAVWRGVSPARPDNAGRESQQRTRATDGFRIVLEHRRLLLLLAIVAAVTLADDPILVLSPALVHTRLHVSSDWAGYFIAALGWGTVLGSLTPTARRSISTRRLSKRAACSLLVLGLSVVVFAAGWSTGISLFAAFVAGAAALFTGAAAQTLIVGEHKAVAASVAALWAMAWAGTKPLASLLDGWLASEAGLWTTGLALALPAIVLAVCEIGLPDKRKQKIKDLATRIFCWIYPDADSAGTSAQSPVTAGEPAMHLAAANRDC